VRVPAARVRVPAARVRVPAARVREPAARVREPAARVREPAARVREPAAPFLAGPWRERRGARGCGPIEGPPRTLDRITPGERGQASVEFVVLLPCIIAIVAVVAQALLAGQAAWEARVASRAAARANAFGHDAATAARGHLRAGLERSLIVKASADGDVRVSIRIPSILPSVSLGRVSATSHFRPQA
jgi:hypothetical protein